MRRLTAILVAAVLASLAGTATAPAADPAPGPYENRADSFRNIAPPGANGLANPAQLAAFQADKSNRPPHNSDQLAMYGDLVYASPGLQASDIGKYFKDASFGVRPDDIERQYDPCGTTPAPLPVALPLPTGATTSACPEVVIQRDKGFGVPHIFGADRSGAMFGAGYVAAEDRLFFIDVLRHYGRAELSSFAGGANVALDREQWGFSPYTEADLQRQIDQFDEMFGETGRQLQRDLEFYTAGVNQYIQQTKADPSKMPGEYAAIGRPQGADPWKGTDVVAIAALVGGIFGKGGGEELDSALFFQEAQKRFGNKRGSRVWSDFRSAEDPEAPTTVHRKRFPYQVAPRRPVKGSVALPDPGSVTKASEVPGGEDSSQPTSGGPVANALKQLFAFPSGNSNALTVSARESESGRPLAVFGPQTGYFSPQVLMEQDMHAPAGPAGPAIAARGTSFPGTNLFVQLGRGDDYAWSATSASQDIVDTFAVDLCEPGGGAPSLESTHYRFRGQCLPIEVLEKTNTFTPNAADQTPPGTDRLRTERTKLGIVAARATVGGRPVLYTRLRTTYGHEVDSAIGFMEFNDPNAINGARSYQEAAHKIGYTFNWLYVDSKDIAYFNSGNNPVRSKRTDQNFPVAARFEWRHFNPELGYGDLTPFEEHPQVINQRFINSWNNKQAPGFRAADSNYGYQSTYRVQPLDDRVRRGIKGANKMSLVELIDAMEDSGTVDHRGDKVLPFVLRVLEGRVAQRTPARRPAGQRPRGRRPASQRPRSRRRPAFTGRHRSAAATQVTDPALRTAIAQLKVWQADGAHRRDRNRDGVYEHSEAIRIMDAWWPLLIEAQFKPVLGEAMFRRLEGLKDPDDEPNVDGAHLGSAYNGGWYGYVQKDLRTLLGDRVRGRYSRIYCGNGKLKRCQSALSGSLLKALAATPADLYGGDKVCNSSEGQGLDPQFCFDAVRHRPLGGISQPLIHWINRPTFQQVVEIK